MASSSSQSAPKRQKSNKDTPYTLIYWPSIPGRGEHIRLLLEEAGASYIDSAQQPDSMKAVTSQISPSNLGDSHNPPPLAPPILKHGDLTISQTPNIIFYLGKRFNLMGEDEEEEDGDGDSDAQWKINSLVLTALDGLSNEPHDVHHPVSTSAYYEEQKLEAERKASDYRKNRLPKFLGYFERVLSGEASKGGEWLYGGKFSVADLVLWQSVDGVRFAFPNAMKRLEREGKYRRVFELYERVRGRERIKAYLGSERRQKYSNGIYRHYPELDEELVE